jgi:hypothetical protein
VTNSQEPKLFFETFSGNNLCFYPRGVAVWGFFDALAGLVVDRVAKVDRTRPALPGVRVPRLLGADWRGGKCRMMGAAGSRARRGGPPPGAQPPAPGRAMRPGGLRRERRRLE